MRDFILFLRNCKNIKYDFLKLFAMFEYGGQLQNFLSKLLYTSGIPQFLVLWCFGLKIVLRFFFTS